MAGELTLVAIDPAFSVKEGSMTVTFAKVSNQTLEITKQISLKIDINTPWPLN